MTYKTTNLVIQSSVVSYYAKFHQVTPQISDSPLRRNPRINTALKYECANDVLLFRQIHIIEDCLALHRDLNAIVKWNEDWQVFFFLILMRMCTLKLPTEY